MLTKSQIKLVKYSIIIFLALFILVYSAGLLPGTDKGDTIKILWDKAQQGEINKQIDQGYMVAVNPTRIVIDQIGVDTLVSNPKTTNATTLDDYLKQGAVRYYGSGFVGSGNMFIFGHSSGWTVVNNQAYKTFNGLKDLKRGDIIKVYGGSSIYEYKVSSVVMKLASEVEINFDSTKNMLTLTTCNVFGDKEDRYIVEADFIQ